MTARKLIPFIFIVFAFLWTLLAWGASWLLNGLMALSAATQDGISLPPQVREGILLWIPQTVQQAWLPWFIQSWQQVAASFPMAINGLSYAIWIVWGLGMVILLLLAIVSRRFGQQTSC